MRIYLLRRTHLLLLANFVFSIALAVATDLLANYLQGHIGLLTDQKGIARFTFVFVVVTAISAYLTLSSLEKGDLVVRGTQIENERLTQIISRIEAITKSYIQDTKGALSPMNLEDFLNAKPQPFRSGRSLEWWEKVLDTGKGPRGTPVTFLAPYVELKDLSTQLKVIANASIQQQYNQMILLVEAVHKQCEDFKVSHELVSFRRNNLREHIQKIQKLNSELDRL